MVMVKQTRMVRNIIIIATRVLLRNKIFSLINIFGLSVGLSCALLILTVVKQQLTFDRFHEHREHLFCLQQKMDLGTGSYTTDRSGGAVGPALEDAFPEFSSSVRLSPTLELMVTYDPLDTGKEDRAGRKRFIEDAAMAVDSNLFSCFTFQSVSGDLATALLDPYSIVLTRETAEKYFGDGQALNKTLILNNEHSFTVTAVIENPPVNSSLQFDLLINFWFLEELGYELDNFNGNPFGTFLYMDDPSLAEGMAPKITSYLEEHQDGGMMAEQRLLSLKHYYNRGERRGQYLNLTLILLGIIILSIACINFMNLSTARYLDRTREVGIRKVVGARRGQLIRQFLGETMILTFLATNLAILLVDSVIPAFNRHFELQVAFQPGDPVILGGLITIFLVSSLFAGSYPAFFLSSFKVTDIFHKAGRGKTKGRGIRRVLVVVQFLFAILFIITSLVNYRQFKLLNESLAGFDSSHVIYFQSRGELNDKYAIVKQEILEHPGVVNVTGSVQIPRYVEIGEISWGLTSGEKNDISAICPVNFDFDETFGMEMAAGRFYSSEISGDSIDAIIINRAMAEALELEDPVGRTFYLYDDPHTIIGVLDNYSFNPLSLMGDKIILPFSKDNNWIFVKTSGLNSETIIDHIEAVHEKHNPEYPFEHLYLDEFTDPITNGFGMLNKIVYFFTFLGILISCLGLLGLSTYSTQQRTKEIGIRKALGASAARILRLLTFDFMKLILVSLAISIPVSILLIRAMLQLFVERVSLGPGLFLLTAVIIISIALLTITFQAMRSANDNPATRLRYE
jgi:putative ABC transport system permease protein